MKGYVFEEVLKIISYQSFRIKNKNAPIVYLGYNSRFVVHHNQTIFFAIKTKAQNGANFISQLYKEGCRNFVVAQEFDFSMLSDANFLIVENTIMALQQMAMHHRNNFNLPVIAITGSNGKTIVKEWLAQSLEPLYDIVKTPQSFNSQIGVPLSVWNIGAKNNLGIFEAGISMPNEMSALEKIIQPNIGIFTNVGEAHNENFLNTEQKIAEKILLFKTTDVVVYEKNIDKSFIEEVLTKKFPKVQHFSFGTHFTCAIKISPIVGEANKSLFEIEYAAKKHLLELPFTDKASINNCLCCLATMLYMKIDFLYIQKQLSQLSNLPMRLSIEHGKNSCLLINDTYSNDKNSLEIALQYLQQRVEFDQKSLVLSDVSGNVNYNDIADVINNLSLNYFIAIGADLVKHKTKFISKNKKHLFFFNTKEDFIKNIPLYSFHNEAILFKGSRKFLFEQVIEHFKKNIHETTLEINLAHIQENFKTIKSHLNASTKIMAIVKAFAYGSGSIEVATLLEKNRIDYFAVAYINEGIQLRNGGITRPIMVMNCNEKVFDFLIQYRLEPEIFSLKILQDFILFLSEKNICDYPVHIKIDTGMNRLGFKTEDFETLLTTLKNNFFIQVKSVFSHLVASEDKNEDDYSATQLKTLNLFCDDLKNILNYNFIKHISNSSAIFRLPQMQLEMVRIGIGLYGINQPNNFSQLKNVLTLKTSIAQIKILKNGEFVGYNKKQHITTETKIAIIRTGYAEGFLRTNSMGNGKVMINHQLAPTIGTVCMDMTMVDISHIDNVNVDDEVIVFGKNLPVENVAKWNNTIAHEVITLVSHRVRREYIF